MTPEDRPTILAMLDLEPLGDDEFRAGLVYTDERDHLFGGQVLAQALLAAGRTAGPGRLPHSVHGYYLRPGTPRRPTLLTVVRERDGRSFSTRRVTAVQDDKPIFSMAASFHVAEGGEGYQVVKMPAADEPESLPRHHMWGLLSIEGTLPDQPHGDTDFPARFWCRVTDPLPPDPLVHAAALAYMSDISHGVLLDEGGPRARASLDHALWFHRPVDMNDWTLTDYVPGSAGFGRGWYSGSIYAHDGTLVASVAQEMLVR